MCRPQDCKQSCKDCSGSNTWQPSGTQGTETVHDASVWCGWMMDSKGRSDCPRSSFSSRPCHEKSGRRPAPEGPAASLPVVLKLPSLLDATTCLGCPDEASKGSAPAEHDGCASAARAASRALPRRSVPLGVSTSGQSGFSPQAAASAADGSGCTRGGTGGKTG